MSEGKLQLHPYEPKETRFVLSTVCRTIARAESWDDVVTSAEALANTLRIVKKIEEQAFREDFSAEAAEQRKNQLDREQKNHQLDRLRELGREMRESQTRGINETANA